MPWKERKPMDERLRFIARLLEGKKIVKEIVVPGRMVNLVVKSEG